MFEKIKGTDTDGYIFIDDKRISKIYAKQFPEKDQTIDVKIMRKELNKEFSRHRIYFYGDFGYKNQLDELEEQKNQALREKDKKTGKEKYETLIQKQKEINIQRQENVINILETQRIPRADYDKDLVEQRNRS